MFEKLVALRPDPFMTTVEVEENFPDSEEGRQNRDKRAAELEAKGLICVKFQMEQPEFTA